MGMEELVGIPSAFPVKMKKTQRVGGKMGGLCWSRKGQVQEYIEEEPLSPLGDKQQLYLD